MKIILFLLLLYFCNTDDCSNSSPPSKTQDCYSRKVDDSEKNYCCYADIKVQEGEDPLNPICVELQKIYSSNEKENVIKDAYNEYSISEVKVQCPGEKNGETTTHNSSSYLKIGFLFILALLF